MQIRAGQYAANTGCIGQILVECWPKKCRPIFGQNVLYWPNIGRILCRILAEYWPDYFLLLISRLRAHTQFTEEDGIQVLQRHSGKELESIDNPRAPCTAARPVQRSLRACERELRCSRAVPPPTSTKQRPITPPLDGEVLKATTRVLRTATTEDAAGNKRNYGPKSRPLSAPPVLYMTLAVAGGLCTVNVRASRATSHFLPAAWVLE
ncbi:hypothetical protein FB451DRAFT_1178958 [Mycena latifolia]|nr:hypothetical protein FB451DRAFT_1178958 [Mycena latifolia]